MKKNKKNEIGRRFSNTVNNQLPPGILLAQDTQGQKPTFSRVSKSHFHRSDKYPCYSFYKPISKIVKPTTDG